VKQQGTEPLWVTILANIVLLSETDQPSSSSLIVPRRPNNTTLPPVLLTAVCEVTDYQLLSEDRTRNRSENAEEKDDTP
jgi:hypothetical protein